MKSTTKTFYLLKTPENLITNLQMHLFKAVQFQKWVQFFHLVSKKVKQMTKLNADIAKADKESELEV